MRSSVRSAENEAFGLISSWLMLRIFCENYLLEPEREQERFPPLRHLEFWLSEDPFLDLFPSFLLNKMGLALIISSSIKWFVSPVCGVWSRRKNRISCWRVTHSSLVSLVPVLSLKILASSPLFWSMVWSPLSVIVLSKGDFLSGSLLILNPFQVFVWYFLPAPAWGVSIRTAVVPKCCILLPFLIRVHWSRITFYGKNSMFL